MIWTPFFSNDDFNYWKGRIEFFLKTQVEMQIMIQTGFTLLANDEGESLGWKQWTVKMKMKIEADAKAT